MDSAGLLMLGRHPMIEELLDLLSAGILHALIGVLHDSGRRLSIRNCPF